MQEAVQQIEQNGYYSLPQVFTSKQIQRALRLVQSWYEQSRDSRLENVPLLNRNQPMIYNLQSKDYRFLEYLFASEKIQEILIYFLNDPWFKQIPASEPNYILRSYLARSSNEPLPLHIDSFVPYVGPHVFAMQISLILEDQTMTNGCTMVVPGSHQSGKYAVQEAFKDAVPLESRAGDVVIWDSRLWHGTLANTSGGTRWAMIATFVRWWLKQAFQIPQSLPQEIYARLTDSQKSIVGFCSLPYEDENQGIDMKRGYGSLAKEVAEYRFPQR
jgi:hypothetical protein